MNTDNNRQKQDQGNWSLRSQVSLIRQDELEGQQTILLQRIERTRKQVRELEEKRDRLAKTVLNSKSPYFPALEGYMADLRVARDMLELHERQLKAIDEQIAGCMPTAAAAATREKNQQALATLVEKRLAVDHQLGELVAQLKKLLQKRSALTGTMAERAKALEMDLDLDQTRFDALLDSLPADLVNQSKNWTDWILARQQNLVRAIVCDEHLVLPEILVHSGVYRQGETIELTEAQFRELSRIDRPAPTDEQPWRCQPPSVVSIKEYDEICVEAKRKNLSPAEVLVWQNLKRQEENKRRYLKKYKAELAATT